ncbi:MAG TPA: alpha/beta hydrolase fold domain-containing protein [Acidimicrobiales bacterium]
MTTHPPRTRPHPEVRLVADLALRGRARRLAARVHWPAPAGGRARPPLLVLLAGGSSGPAALDEADPLCRAVCRFAGVVVLAVSGRTGWACFQTAALDDAATATGWAADHAAELGADPRRLVVAGEALGARLAAAVALRARDDGWPDIIRQVLIRPELRAGRDRPGSPWRDVVHLPADAASWAGVAPATVAVAAGDSDRGGDGGGEGEGDGGWYATLLRHAGVEVHELRAGGRPPGGTVPPPDTAAALGRAVARALCRTLASRPGGPGPHGGVAA